MSPPSRPSFASSLALAPTVGRRRDRVMTYWPGRLGVSGAWWPRSIPLGWALMASLLGHVLLLAVHFEVPQKIHQASHQMLDVILVNARSQQAPTDPQARAQANLDGGGNSDQERVASTPLPATKDQRAGDALQAAQQKVAQLEDLQQQLLQQLRSQSTQVGDAAPLAAVDEGVQARDGDLASRALAMARLEGKIERQTEAYNKRPRKKFIGARTTEYRFAQYEEDWRQKIERIGNLNYPEAAKGKAYGTLVLTVEINADGSIASITIDRSSGKPVLDAAARRIVQMAAPFPAFPPNLADVDIIGITRTWSFTREDRLHAN